ncbi:DUF1893 domain-containing protein [Miniphocaeibacter massiliensis]|uniref:DUF1893 domain-containing protein n=1 Tax=Miniphocaeibacter massiliensis TaxID=2041841 RepID=UPI0013EA2DAC|nr:DUF1893 domain-containing protein [Miniphocaeibacter massiliensis]
MENIDLAKDKLLEGKYKIVVVKDNNIIFKSDKSGIVPMYDFYNSSISGIVSIADKFIGSGAAKLLINKNIDIEELFVPIVSEGALELLNKYRINIKYGRKVKKILNRTGNDLCPVEKISLRNDNFKDFYNELFEFLKNTKQI